MSNVLDVAKHLSDIEDLAQRLAEQAEHQASARVDGTELPGGLAMIALAPVANQEAWEAQFEARERLGRDHSHIADEDDDWVPILQTLCFWSEQWRAIHGAEYDQRPTIASEAAFIRWALNWAWDNELHFDDFAKDIAYAVRRLEDVLHAGERVERGVPCMYDECRGKRLARKVIPGRDEQGNKTWKVSDWHCPGCKRSWDDEAYRRNVAAANWRAQREDVDGETWCSTKYAATLVKRPEATIRSWVAGTKAPRTSSDRDYPIATACILTGRRIGFVRLADVEERDTFARRRGRRAA